MEKLVNNYITLVINLGSLNFEINHFLECTHKKIQKLFILKIDTVNIHSYYKNINIKIFIVI